MAHRAGEESRSSDSGPGAVGCSGVKSPAAAARAGLPERCCRWLPLALAIALAPALQWCNLLAEHERWAVAASGALLAAQRLSDVERHFALVVCSLVAAVALGPPRLIVEGCVWLAGGIAVAGCLWATGCLPFPPQQCSKDDVHRMLVEIFQRFDTYGDGTISCVRLTRALEKLNLDHQSIDLAIASSEGGGAERINYQKFASWVTGFHEPEQVPEERHFEGPLSLRASVAAGEAVLLRATWLTKYLREGGRGVLPPREDLPPEALWNAKELFGLGERMLQHLRRGGHVEFLPIVSVSFSQEEQPGGEELETLVIALDHLCTYFAKAFEEINCPADCGVFLDRCSLLRPPGNRPGMMRSCGPCNKQNVEEMGLWYGHGLVRKLLLRGRSATASEEGGLAFLQSALSGMISQHQLVLRLGGLDVIRGCQDWPSLRKACMAGRATPLTPEAFVAMLDSKPFTEATARSAAVHSYRAAFKIATGGCRRLILANLGWGGKEARMLTKALVHFTGLSELFLEGNCIGDAGAELLAGALPHCPSLKEVLLARNQIADQGAQHLAKALSRCRIVERVELQENLLGEVGTAGLAKVLPAMGCLRDLLLQGNGLGDAGVQALARALPSRPSLERLVLDATGAGDTAAAQLGEAIAKCGRLLLLHLEGNPLSEAARQALRKAWHTAGKPERSELNGRGYPALML